MTKLRAGLLVLFLTAGSLTACSGKEAKSVAFTAVAAKAMLDGRFDDAISSLTTAIEHDPKNARAYSYRGECHYYLKDFDKAIADLDRALALDPDRPTTLSVRGLARAARDGYSEGAIKDSEKACSLGVKKACSRAKEYSKRRKVDRANTLYAKGVEIFKAGRIDEAISLFTESITLNPTLLPDSHGYRAKAYAVKGDTASALRDYAEACRLGNDFCCKEAAKLRSP